MRLNLICCLHDHIPVLIPLFVSVCFVCIFFSLSINPLQLRLLPVDQMVVSTTSFWLMITSRINRLHTLTAASHTPPLTLVLAKVTMATCWFCSNFTSLFFRLIVDLHFHLFQIILFELILFGLYKFVVIVT